MECLHGVGHGLMLSTLAATELDLAPWTPCSTFRFNFPYSDQGGGPSAEEAASALTVRDDTLLLAARHCHAAPQPQLAFAAAVGLFHEV